MKKLRKSIDRQLESANIRALKPHGINCPDMLTCAKKDCFVREPDKIVGLPYEVVKK
jgi:hypothetical protein